jgi:hypothetical protein
MRQCLVTEFSKAPMTFFVNKRWTGWWLPALVFVFGLGVTWTVAKWHAQQNHEHIVQ